MYKNHYQKYDDLSLSDDCFEQMWHVATTRKSTFRWKYYAIAALVAILLSVGSSVVYFQTSRYVKAQYEMGQQALQYVSGYLNSGIMAFSKVQQLDYLTKLTGNLSIVDKEISKMKAIENLYIIEVDQP